MAKRKKHKQYPWSRWLSQARLRLVRGRHFDCMPYCMAAQVRNAATLYGVKVSIKIKENALLVMIL